MGAAAGLPIEFSFVISSWGLSTLGGCGLVLMVGPRVGSNVEATVGVGSMVGSFSATSVGTGVAVAAGVAAAGGNLTSSMGVGDGRMAL